MTAPAAWQNFRSYHPALLTPTLLFLLIISTISAFQSFTQFNVLIANEGPNGSTNVLVFALFTAFFKDNRYGFASAIAVVLFVVLLILSVIQFRLLDQEGPLPVSATMPRPIAHRGGAEPGVSG